MIHQVGGQLRKQINRFSGELSFGLCKPRRRFVEEMIYGIQARGSVRLTEVARALEEEISLKKTEERLSANLAGPRIREVVGDAILAGGASRIGRDTLLILEPSDLCKKCAQKMERLAQIRDGSEKTLGNGYWLGEVVGAEVGGTQIVPPMQSLWSQEAPDFVSENDEILTLVRRVWGSTEGRGIWVVDRGGDRRELYKELVPGGYRFLIRQRGDRHILYKGQPTATMALAAICPLPWAETIMKEEAGEEKVYRLEFGSLPVRLAEWPEVRLWLVVVKGFGREPMLLLTTEQMKRSRPSVWWAVEAYLTRWRVEETIRFIKQSYELEDIRVLTYDRMKNLATLVFACFYFAAGWLGTKVKLEVLACHVPDAANRLFGIPDFRHYALADGIKEVLWRVGKGRLRPRGSGPPEMALLPLFDP